MTAVANSTKTVGFEERELEAIKASFDWVLYTYVVETDHTSALGKSLRTKRRVHVYCPIATAAVDGAGAVPGQTVRLSGQSKASGYIQRKSIPTKDMTVLYENLSSAARGGLPIEQAIEMSIRTVRSPSSRGIIAAMLNIYKKLGRLHLAMKAFPKAFDEVTVSLVEAGESAGSGFEELLGKLHSQSVKGNRQRTKLMGAMAYPLAIIVGVFLAGYLAMTNVIPGMAERYQMYEVFHRFPPISKWVYDFNLAMEGLWLPVIGLLVISSFAAILNWNRFWNAQTTQSIVIKLPVVGKVIRLMAFKRIISSYVLLRKAQVGIADTFNKLSGIAGLKIYKDYIAAIYARISSGSQVHTAMSQEWPLIGTEGIELASKLELGEATGKTDELLTIMAEDMENSVDVSIQGLPQVLSFGVLAMSSLPLFFIVLAVMQAIMGLNTALLPEQ